MKVVTRPSRPVRGAGTRPIDVARRQRPEEPPGVTIHWFTDADRQDMRDAAEERRVLDELVQKYAPTRTMTAEERAEAIARQPMMSRMSTLQINPYRRS
jgi:hypothetical protein